MILYRFDQFRYTVAICIFVVSHTYTHSLVLVPLESWTTRWINSTMLVHLSINKARIVVLKWKFKIIAPVSKLIDTHPLHMSLLVYSYILCNITTTLIIFTFAVIFSDSELLKDLFNLSTCINTQRIPPLNIKKNDSDMGNQTFN